MGLLGTSSCFIIPNFLNHKPNSLSVSSIDSGNSANSMLDRRTLKVTYFWSLTTYCDWIASFDRSWCKSKKKMWKPMCYTPNTPDIEPTTSHLHSSSCRSTWTQASRSHKTTNLENIQFKNIAFWCPENLQGSGPSQASMTVQPTHNQTTLWGTEDFPTTTCKKTYTKGLLSPLVCRCLSF